MADTQQAVIVDETTWEDKLDAIVDDIVDGTEEPIEDEAAPEEDNAEEPIEEPEDQQDDLVEVEYDGKAYQVPPELKDAMLRHSDYTRKTQEVAEMRRQVEMQAAMVQEAQAFQAAHQQKFAQLSQVESQLAQLQQIDWNALADSDPMQYLKLDRQARDLSEIRNRVMADIHGAHQQYQAHREQQIGQTVQEGTKILTEKIKGWSKELASQLKSSAAQNYGFTEAELAQVYDPRMVQVLHDAYKWRQLESAKPQITKRVNAAPKAAKPSGKVDDPGQTRRDMMKQLKSSKDGRKREAIAYRMLDKFV